MGETRARRQTCKNVPELFGIYYELYGTVSLVYNFTSAPSHFYVFTATKSLAPRARTGATVRVLSDHAGLTRTSTAYLRGR